MTAFANLTELKAGVAEWINRDDLSDARIESFVRLGEEQISLFLRSRFNKVSYVAYLDTTGRIAIPDDYQELVLMRPVGTWDGDDIGSAVTATQAPLVPVSYQSLASYDSFFGSPAPINFAETPDASAWALYPTGYFVIEVNYYADLTTVTDVVLPQLFLRHSGMYLAAALVEYENYLKLKDAERGPWRDKLNAYITRLNADRRATELSGGTLVTRSPYR